MRLRAIRILARTDRDDSEPAYTKLWLKSDHYLFQDVIKKVPELLTKIGQSRNPEGNLMVYLYFEDKAYEVRFRQANGSMDIRECPVDLFWEELGQST